MLKDEIHNLKKELIELIENLKFDEIAEKLLVISRREKEHPLNSDIFAYLALEFKVLFRSREFTNIQKEFDLNRRLEQKQKKYLQSKTDLLEYFTWFDEHSFFENNTGRVFSKPYNVSAKKLCQKINDCNDFPLSSELVRLIEVQIEECSSYQYQSSPRNENRNGWVIKRGFYLEYVEKVESLTAIKRKLKDLRSIEDDIIAIHSNKVYTMRSKPELELSSNVSLYIRGVCNMVDETLMKFN